MKKLNSFFSATLVVVFLCLGFTGCTTFEVVEDFLSENPILTQIAARQGVGHYIAKGETIESEAKRAGDVYERITKYLSFIDGNPQATIEQFTTVIQRSIPWDEMSVSDRMLVTDIVGYIEAELRRSKPEEPELSEQTTFAIKALLQTAANTALIYLNR